MSRQLVILDRDGVINHDSDAYVKSPDEWKLINGSALAIGELTSAGFTVVVATNQSGVGRNFFDLETLSEIHAKMLEQISARGGVIAAVEFCPHLPADHCDCRKPRAGMLTKLARQFLTPLEGVPIIGDSLRDIDAADAVGARPMLVLTGNGVTTAATLDEAGRQVEIFADLADAATTLIAEMRSPG